ncbi:hydrolase [Bifidobacterium sp. DSM 109958]|uniref:Hydrolase n=1 Tax=Bifidobacterium moraviense TaxID=2675323 RepID=A0A7Y0F170_9BIFI|nr:HAD-IIB family hydrolase [Bifidobacterium sp. DSM 109958]NMN00086.1 hydrolase [Bifidobacterium sp. DSM 109958]
MLPNFIEDAGLGDVRVIASDMDCTLLADDGTMPPHMAERIRALDAAGVTFCAASGRPSYTLAEMFPGLEDHMAFMSDNGAAIRCRGELVYTSLIPVGEYRRMIEFTLADGRGCPTVCGIEACFVRSCDRVYDEYFRTFYKRIVYMDDLTTLDRDVNKYTVFFPRSDSEEVYRDLYRDAWSGSYSVTAAGRMWIDMMNPGVNKGTGLIRLCGHLGVDVRDACALGDTYNDVEMLETAGHGYVVANAEEHMRAHAGWLAPSNNDRGVASVIDAVLAAGRRDA